MRNDTPGSFNHTRQIGFRKRSNVELVHLSVCEDAPFYRKYAKW